MQQLVGRSAGERLRARPPGGAAGADNGRRRYSQPLAHIARAAEAPRPPPFEPLSNRAAAGYHSASVILGAAALTISITVLLGWEIDQPMLRSLVRHHVETKPNTAIALLLAAGCLLLRSLAPRSARALRAAQLLCVGIVAIGLATLFEWLSGVSLGIDQLLFHDVPRAIGTPHAGRPAVNALIALLLIAGALWLEPVAGGARWSQWLAVGAAAVGLVAVLGYASDVHQLYGELGNAEMALPTAIALLALGFGIAALHPDEGMVAWVTRASPGGRLARRLVPAAVLVPVALALLRIGGTHAGLFGASVGLWLVQLLTIALLCGAVALAARALDETERSRLIQEQLAARSEQQFQTLIEGANEGVWVVDEHTTTRFVNRALAEMLGTTPQGMVGHPSRDYVDEEARKEVDAHLRRRAQGEAERYELRLRRAGGEPVWALVSATPLFRPDGSYAGSLSMLTDISERRRADAELRRLASMVNYSRDAIFSIDPHGLITSWNLGAELVFGYRAHEIVGRPVGLLVPATRAQAEQEILDRVLAGAPVRHYEAQRRRKDGEIIDVSVTVSPILAAFGEITGVSSVSRDITEEKLVRETVRRSEELLRGGFEHSPIGMAVVDLDGRLERANRAFAEMLGYRGPEELVGAEYTALTHPDDVARDGEGIRMMLATGDPYTTEKRYVRRDGAVIDAILGATVLTDEQGRATALFTQVENITERRRAERRILELNASLEDRVQQRTAELEAANSELEGFAYSVAHDLRTPLRAIDGFGGVLVREHGSELGAEARGVVDRMRSASRRGGELIDAMLMLSELTRRELSLETIDLSAVAHEVAVELAAGSERNVEFVIEPGLELTGDRRLVRVLIFSLLDNAWKFTAPRLRARIEVVRVNPHVFAVRDNGVGFDPRYAQMLFKPFSRLHRDDEFEGTGLGLATVERIVRRHGGSVWGEGRPNAGAAFYFSLDRKETTHGR